MFFFFLIKVYINNCSVHLVQNSPSNTSTILPVSLAISKIRNNPGLYKVTADIERCIEKRIKKFPININELQCKSTVFLPIAAAALLKHKPALIAAAVRAFYNRDSIDMKACRVMKYFPPENRVFTQITFTKCLYAMLMNTKYQPDRRIGWNLPPTTDPSYKAHILGIKIACGFEILASQAQQQQQPTKNADGVDVDDDNIENSKEWQKFLTTLQANGYFQKFLEFSQDYNRLLNGAKEYFKENFQFSYGREIGKEILMELKKINYTNEDFKFDEQSLPVDDNDDWLHITPEELDNMLTARYGITKIINTNDNINNNEANELTENITNFLNKKSDIDGIECNNNSFDLLNKRPIPPKRTKKVNKNNTVNIIYNDNNNNNTKIEHSDGDDDDYDADNLNVQVNRNGDNKLKKQTQQNVIDFNADAFQNHVKDMLDLVIPEDKWESNSDISDFGGDESDLEKNMNDDMMNEDNINVKKSKIKTSLKSYMDQMDRELAKTTIGASFEKQKSNDRHSQHNCGAVDDGDDDFDDIETFKPVDIDMNTLKHMANSYQSQFGGPGPVSNLLGTMGMKLTTKSNENDIDIKNYNTQV